jgi:pimeloyl-ACP methyl ester carboxylesterase
MTRILKSLILGASCWMVASAPDAQGQSTVPVVFVHGLMLDSTSWSTTRGYVASNLYAQVYGRTINWRQSFENQRDTMIAYLSANSISNSSYLVGHSAGGVVARMVGGAQTLQGIMTVGTPNAGAPMRDNAAYPFGLAVTAYNDAVNVAAVFFDCESAEDDTALWAEIATGVGYGLDYMYGAANEVENYIGQFYPVFDEIGSSSTFMESTLPGAGESSHVSARIGMTFIADDYYDGAAWQLLDPAYSGDITDLVNGSGALAIDLGYYLLGLPAYGDTDIEVAHEYEADALFSLGDDLEAWDQVWCGSLAGGGYDCLPNDLLVPEWSQEYYGMTVYLPYTGVNHPDEPYQYTTVSSALHNYFGIASR